MSRSEGGFKWDIDLCREERVLQNEVAFGIVFGEMMFLIFLIFGGGVQTNICVIHSYSYDLLVQYNPVIMVSRGSAYLDRYWREPLLMELTVIFFLPWNEARMND